MFSDLSLFPEEAAASFMLPSTDLPTVVVAGHICLDVIPSFETRTDGFETLLTPGKLVEVGPPIVSTGGAVPNTGLALHRIGIPTRLIGKVGNDLFGKATLDVLNGYDEQLASDMIVAPGEPSSYTVVVAPPGVDRVFLHYPGVNDTFRPDEVTLDHLSEAKIFHFGYPPLMRQTYADGGAGLAELFRKIRARGLVVSLDMARPDPAADSGQVDWTCWMQRVLPHVDIFAPSFNELLYMLDRARYDRLVAQAGAEHLMRHVDGSLLQELADRLIEMGVPVVAMKLGQEGLYLRTTEQAEALSAVAGLGNGGARCWVGRELLHPCFQVVVTGTTGAGDATLAGFLGGLAHGLPPEKVLQTAVAVGACSVEAADATSGVPSWPILQARIRSGWSQQSTTLTLSGWRREDGQGLWRGPRDAVSV